MHAILTFFMRKIHKGLPVFCLFFQDGHGLNFIWANAGRAPRAYCQLRAWDDPLKKRIYKTKNLFGGTVSLNNPLFGDTVPLNK